MGKTTRIAFAVLGSVLALADCGHTAKLCDNCTKDSDCAGIQPVAIEGYCCVSSQCVPNIGAGCEYMRERNASVDGTCR